MNKIFDKLKAIQLVSHKGSYLNKLDYLNKNDPDVVMAAIKQKPASFQFASENIKNNINFIKEAFNNNINIFEFINNELQNDKEICLQYPQFIIESLITDKLYNDPEVVSKIIKNTPRGFLILDRSNLNDNMIFMLNCMLENISMHVNICKFIGNTLKNNLEFANFAINLQLYNYIYFSYEIQSNKEII
jgi:hypothetical protein